VPAVLQLCGLSCAALLAAHRARRAAWLMMVQALAGSVCTAPCNPSPGGVPGALVRATVIVFRAGLALGGRMLALHATSLMRRLVLKHAIRPLVLQ
jgi:hypothetical protein